MKFAALALIATAASGKASFNAKPTGKSDAAKLKIEIYNEGGIPTGFCPDGVRHVVAVKPQAKIYSVQKKNQVNEGLWDFMSSNEKSMYNIKTSGIHPNLETYFHFFELRNVACLDKNADLTKINSPEDLDEGTETYTQIYEWSLGRDMEQVQDLYWPLRHDHTQAEINALVQSKGLEKDPELVDKHSKEYADYFVEKARLAEEKKVKEEEEAKEKSAQDLVDAEANGKFAVRKLNEGDGNHAKTGQKIKAHYTGTLLDGTKFDSSRDRGQVFEFTLGVGQVISCWDQGFAQLTRGQKAILTCPPDMAYGSQGAGGLIPPNAVLKFDVELVDF